jgi:hypothetical protein
MRYSLSNPCISVSIEYTRKGERVVRHFTDCRQAKSFYVRKHRQGKQPRIVLAS